MMDRRRFLLTSLAGALATPLAAGAQRAKVPVIGVLSPGGPALRPEGQREPFERGLRDSAGPQGPPSSSSNGSPKVGPIDCLRWRLSWSS